MTFTIFVLPHLIKFILIIFIRPCLSRGQFGQIGIAAQAALADADAHLTPEQRELIASFIEGEEGPERRDYTLRIRLTESERAELESRAGDEDISSYVRKALGL
jgi:hypothetical protein